MTMLGYWNLILLMFIPLFFKLTNYLKSNTPHILFTDKDRVNRLAILCKLLFKIPTKVFVRIGTTVSINLNSRGF